MYSFGAVTCFVFYNMKLKFLCPFWGSEHLSAGSFVRQALDAGFDGIEINIPDDTIFERELLEALQKSGADWVAQQWLPPQVETVEAYSKRMLWRLRKLAALNPLFINSHTGKDYYSLDDNCFLLEQCREVAEETKTRILHETHRGRFNFQVLVTTHYLRHFPDLELTADFSHFCAVSESLLEDQEDLLEKIIPHCTYIHARVGFDQGPQVNNPFAPEWEMHLRRFLAWWQAIIDAAKQRGESVFYICPEFGPYPYIQQLPFTRKETADQWQVNVQMMNFLKKELKA